MVLAGGLTGQSGTLERPTAVVEIGLLTDLYHSWELSGRSCLEINFPISLPDRACRSSVARPFDKLRVNEIGNLLKDNSLASDYRHDHLSHVVFRQAKGREVPVQPPIGATMQSEFDHPVVNAAKVSLVFNPADPHLLFPRLVA